MPRNDFIYFPTLNQLEEILTKEQRRPVAQGKTHLHYPDFASIIALVTSLGIDASFFTNSYSKEDIHTKNLPQVAQRMVEQVVRVVTKLPDTNTGIYDQIYDYLSKEDALETCDIVFVFGSKTMARIERAVALMKQRRGRLLVISGGMPIYEKERRVTESEIYKKYALEQGIAENTIVTEDTSISIPDNVRSSLNLLDNKGIAFKSVALVNSPYCQRRGWAHFKKYLPDSTKMVRANAQTVPKYSKNEWYMHEDGIRVMLNECIKMKIAVILNTA